MFWTLLPFGVVAFLILGILLTAGAMDHRRVGVHDLKGTVVMENTKNQGLYRGKRFAVVDDTPIRYLSREEFESLKSMGTNLLEMKAGNLIYLTKIPR